MTYLKPARGSAALRALLMTLLTTAASIPSAQAADDSEHALDIVVTAQRRSERILDVPVAITAIERETISRARLSDVKDVTRLAPGFSGASDDSYIDSVAVRGITSNDYGIGGDPSIGLFKDGVYQGRTGAAVTSLYDVERAEALRGPQGFLFGRNATSGAISIITAKPVLGALSGHVDAALGTANRKELEAAINIPAGQHWAFRATGYVADYDGWIDNLYTPDRDDKLLGGRKLAGRASALYERDALKVTLIAEHEHRRLDGTPYRASNSDREVMDYLDAALGQTIVVRGGGRDADSDLVNPRDDGDITSLSALVEAPLGFADLSSITAYRHATFHYLEDYDGTPLFLGNYDQRQRSTYVSQELRLVSPSHGHLTWSTGLSGYVEIVRARFMNEGAENLVCVAGNGYADCDALTQDLYGTSYNSAANGVLTDVNDAASRNFGLSAFADANLRLWSKFVVGAGVRYSWDRKRFTINILPSASTLGNVWTFTYYTDGPISASKSWNGLTPRLFVRYEPSRNWSLYASVTRGYKAGGFGSFTISAPSPVTDYSIVPPGTTPDAFDPETIWSKEIGAKGFALDRKVQFDLTAFHYVYRNLQTNFFNPDTRVVEVINVGRVRGVGVEAALTLRPNRYVDVAGNVTWTHTRKSGDRECVQADCGGLPNPAWATSGIATGHLPLRAGEAYLQGEWTYLGHRRESFDWRGVTRAFGFTTVNLRLGYRSAKGWEAAAYVQNVTNSLGFQGAENNGGLTPSNAWGVSQPRNAGLQLRYGF